MSACGHPLCAVIDDGTCHLATQRSRGCRPNVTAREVAPAVFDELRTLVPAIDAGDRGAAVRLAQLYRREALDDRNLIVLARDEDTDLAAALARLCVRAR